MEDENKKSKIAAREEEILSFWETNKIFQKTLEKNKSKEFVFYDGPPFATGLPHYGHILAGTIKDVIPRFKTMCGYLVPRRWGWDCHGLPVENEVEKELGFKSKKDIENYGIEKFNERAGEIVMKYSDDWRKVIPRMGRFIDMDDDYRTADREYTESVWWVFKTLYDKDLIYEGFKSMHLCPRCETTLSNFEVTQNYKELADMSAFVKFSLLSQANTFLIAWTTTPWTLIGNVALAVNPEHDYALVVITASNSDEIKIGDTYIIGAKESILRRVFASDDFEFDEKSGAGSFSRNGAEVSFSIKKGIKGKNLIGQSYSPLFDTYSRENELVNHKNGWKIYGGEFITEEDGTGVVHIAPAFGEDDYQLALKEKLPFIQHVSTDGTFKQETGVFAGILAKPKGNPRETDEKIVDFLDSRGRLFKKEIYKHDYPHCWRCETPLLNFAAPSWFVRVSALKDQLVSENKKINWIPQEVGKYRFGNWLSDARDWAVSRSRFWGAPIPVWKCERCGFKRIIGSIGELEQLGADSSSVKDLHRPFIDKIILRCEKCEKSTGSGDNLMRRVHEVFDCWFESGAMPYGQAHFPFEQRESFDPVEGFFKKSRGFPADFIAEGLDQTRGWFYSLLVLGVGLFERSPFRAVVVNGIILAENGVKMSKRLKNYPDPIEIVNKYGADSLRFYLLSSSVVRGEDLCFSERGVDEIAKKVFTRLDNVLQFYLLYADAESITRAIDYRQSRNVLDRWIVARLNILIKCVTESLERYELDRAARPIADFIEDLSVWYLRRSRERIKSSVKEERESSLYTLRRVLFDLSRLIAPFAPFFSEYLYGQIYRDSKSELYGEAKSVHLESWPKILRSEDSVLKKMEEVRQIVSLGLEARAKANIKVRQPLLTFRVPASKFKISDDFQFIDLIKAEVNVKNVVFEDMPEAELDLSITPELKDEGAYREFVRFAQETRKKLGFKPSEMAVLLVAATGASKRFIEQHEQELSRAVCLKNIVISDLIQGGESFQIDEISLAISLSRD